MIAQQSQGFFMTHTGTESSSGSSSSNVATGAEVWVWGINHRKRTELSDI